MRDKTQPAVTPGPITDDSEVIEVPLRKVITTYNTLFAKTGERYGFAGLVFSADNKRTADTVFGVSSDSSVAVVEGNEIVAMTDGECLVTVAVSGAPTFSAVIRVTVGSAKWYGGFTYIDGILVVNKVFAVPQSFAPKLTSEFNTAFSRMKQAAAKDGIDLWVQSGYRSYSYQATLNRQYIERNGAASAEISSARAGHSEHQTGLAADINQINAAFANTAAGKWLAANAHRFGFILRYMDGKTDITGYKFEPWHFRYVGVEHATAMHTRGVTLEEYLGIDWIPSVYSE